MDKIVFYSNKAKALASVVKTRSLAAAKDPKMQATVGSAAGGTVMLGMCGGALGVVAGGAAGAAVGLPFVLFTFGLSVPISAALGGGVAGSTGLVVGGTAGCATGGSAGYTAFTYRMEIQQFANNVLVKVRSARDVSWARAANAYAATQDRVSAMRAVFVTQFQNAAAVAKSRVSTMTNSGIQVVKDRHAQATAAGATVGGFALGGAGGVVGMTTGALAGGVVGLVPALFTFGLSIPFCAVVGSGAGLCAGTAIGSTSGIVGGGAVGYGVYGKRSEISEGVQKCTAYTSARLGAVKAFVQGKTTAAPSTAAPTVIREDTSASSTDLVPQTPSRASVSSATISPSAASLPSPQRPLRKDFSGSRIIRDAPVKTPAAKSAALGFTRSSPVWIGA